ncbi:hypothetical protein [Pseudosporangium ferrugineum]|uniref:Uncharacterized protein n=1 Tax=Pseudosporangium ferrugineum TaxID=439699 RepID=A0A2T0RFR1_9ACTN|nr:hypothetical protein [Pseudosporangium ferrugineum]PRY20008.1 hypothetical protein CLV70_12646 [Pseudosporangium ferrugineum]
MSIFSTLLLFAGIPLGVIIVVAASVVAGSRRSRPDRRYRPGRPYDFAPTWFLASPAQVSPAFGGKTGDRVTQQPALESGAVEGPAGRQIRPGAVGGASDRW